MHDFLHALRSVLVPRELHASAPVVPPFRRCSCDQIMCSLLLQRLPYSLECVGLYFHPLKRSHKARGGNVAERDQQWHISKAHAHAMTNFTLLASHSQLRLFLRTACQCINHAPWRSPSVSLCSPIGAHSPLHNAHAASLPSNASNMIVLWLSACHCRTATRNSCAPTRFGSGAQQRCRSAPLHNRPSRPNECPPLVAAIRPQLRNSHQSPATAAACRQQTVPETPPLVSKCACARKIRSSTPLYRTHLSPHPFQYALPSTN